MPTGMIIDGVFASEAIDSSGEVLDVEGCDISTLDRDGVLNYEHKEGDKKGLGNNGEEIVGKIIYCHKIMKLADCETERQKMYWEKIGHLPFIYGMCRLYDGAGHSGAQALAAQIRDHHANDEPILVRFSIEGSTLERKGNRLKNSVARRVAATLKPCNRTAVSGLIEDPKAPTGFEKNPGEKEGPIKDVLAGLLDDHRDSDDAKKREHEHPMYAKLGGSAELECSPLIKDEGDLKKAVKLIMKTKMLKALAAGNYNVSPSALTGGAALQREHLSGLKNRAMAALRDYGKKNFDKAEFKAILKTKLPEADDSFIDHFANMVDEYHVKLKKMELVKKEPAAPKTSKAQKPKAVKTKADKVSAQKPEKVKLPKVEAAAPEMQGPAPYQLTVRGKPAPTPRSDELYFDEKSGVLHVPPAKAKYNSKNGKWSQGHTGGQFKMYIPGQHDPMLHATKSQAQSDLNSFNSIMQDPKVNEFHNYAMDNWQKVHKMLKAGTLPPEVVMHGSLFAMLSPNTPVPMQEYMYGHLVDSMRHAGIDARDPAFAQMKGDWTGRDTGLSAPQVSPEHWKRLENQIKIKSPSYQMAVRPGAQNAGDSGKNLIHARDEQGNKIINRPAGSYGSFMLANNKFDNMANYHNIHDQLVDHVNRHGVDARSAVHELMANKDEEGKWNNARNRALKTGKADPGPYPNLAVRGFAPKVARYTYGMLGGGNVQVPDTHFTRYLFGLEKGKGSTKRDNDTIETLKGVLWNEQNSHILEGIDRHYAAHHPAVQHMVEHPRYGHLFTGADREQAIFPAFWKNWVSIVPHEQARGYATSGVNEYTDHRPYWETVDPFLKKSETGIEHTLPMRTAMLHKEWVRRYGDVPALVMYYRHLVPRLIAAGEAQRKQTAVRKMEALTIDLRKAADEIKDSTETQAEEHDDGAIHFAGNHVRPGKAVTADGEYALLHEDKTHYVAVPADRVNNFDPHHLTKLPKAKQGTHFLLYSRPSVLVSDLEN